MATLRELKGRISSVASSEKITGAMKMISSAKMHKAEQALKQLLPFRRQIELIIGNLLSTDAEFSSPLTEAREVKRLAVVIWGSDDGLCGAYNVNIFKQLLEAIVDYRQKYGDSVEITVIPVGSKITKAVQKIATGTVKCAPVEGVNSKTDGEAVTGFCQELQRRFLAGDYDRVDMLYMHFKSVSRQTPAREQLLPVTQEAFVSAADPGASNRPCIFEPSAEAIFASILPMLQISVIHDVFTENRASEQAARVMAMQSANDNAKKLFDQLQLEYNKLRQQSITTELLDILGGQVK
ncbi:MAG: ATP synthase F1 subunit gamma [Bacteroidales bacterium]|nr:ATP synthase F1 subunit gamma [Bacteroidales bacterium]MCD8393722.1 ATP synthase F1 subunit gamma [Bacteroidales bacterium]